MDSISPHDPDENLPVPPDKESAVKERLKVFADDLRRAADGLETLGGNPEPEPDTKHFHAEVVRQVAIVRDRCAKEADQFAYIANAKPDSVSINRLASMLGISVNTLRAKLPPLQQGTDEPTDEQPF